MDAITWIQLHPTVHPGRRLSWHVVFHEIWTRCGRLPDVDAPRAVDLPLGERSCETCARLVIHDVEPAG